MEEKMACEKIGNWLSGNGWNTNLGKIEDAKQKD